MKLASDPLWAIYIHLITDFQHCIPKMKQNVGMLRFYLWMSLSGKLISFGGKQLWWPDPRLTLLAWKTLQISPKLASGCVIAFGWLFCSQLYYVLDLCGKLTDGAATNEERVRRKKERLNSRKGEEVWCPCFVATVKLCHKSQRFLENLFSGVFREFAWLHNQCKEKHPEREILNLSLLFCGRLLSGGFKIHDNLWSGLSFSYLTVP